MKTVEEQLLEAGYAASPNNIHNLPGTGWYAAGPGKPTTRIWEEIRTSDNRIYIFKTDFFRTLTDKGKYTHTIIDSFDNDPPWFAGVKQESAIEKMTNWLKENGRISEPGLPPYIWVD